MSVIMGQYTVKACNIGYISKMQNPRLWKQKDKISFITFLFAMCFTINAFFCSTYIFYELVDKTTAIETWTVSKSIVSDGDGDSTIYYQTSFLSNNSTYYETITKNTCPIFIAEVIPKGISLLLFRIQISSGYHDIFITRVKQSRDGIGGICNERKDI